MKAPAKLLLPLCLCTLLPGCLVVAAAAVAGGVIYTTGDDSTEVTFERSWEQVFAACEAELEDLGSVSLRDRHVGLIEGYVDEAKVEIKLEQPTPSTVKVAVQARRHGGVSPDSDTAEKVAHGLLRRLGY